MATRAAAPASRLMISSGANSTNDASDAAQHSGKIGPMFKTFFCKSIWDGDDPESSTMFAMLQRQETLAFAPTPGMQISWHGVAHPLIAVRWEVDEQHFVCNMKDEFRHSIDDDTYEFDWLLKFATDNGWSLVSKEQWSPR